MSDAGSGGSKTYALRPPGLPCPNCGAPIVVEPQTLLAAKAIECPACGLELTINREQSAATLDALRQHLETVEAAGKRIDQVVSEAAPPEAPAADPATPPAPVRRKRKRRSGS